VRIAAYLLTILLSFSAGSLAPYVRASWQQPSPQEIDTATNGAFRDGLYLGQQDAQAGIAPHVSVGRWSSTADRSAFRAGYEQGYRGAE